jgi:N-acetylmuramoyl-L-alanine amidase
MRARQSLVATLRCALVAALSCAAFAAPASADAPPESDRFDTVVIDAGHGGEDEGAKGPGGSVEKDVVLDVAARLAAQLRERRLRVVMTRDADRFVPLERRTAIGNDARGDLFVSIHANAAPDQGAHGVETYFLSLDATDEAAAQVAERENGAFRVRGAAAAPIDDPVVAILGNLMANEHLSESSAFARMAESALANREARASRGVKQAPFVVLVGLQMPASLVEVGFITNRQDEARLSSREGRDQIARRLASAVHEYGRRHDSLRGVARADAGGGG